MVILVQCVCVYTGVVSSLFILGWRWGFKQHTSKRFILLGRSQIYLGNNTIHYFTATGVGVNRGDSIDNVLIIIIIIIIIFV